MQSVLSHPARTHIFLLNAEKPSTPEFQRLEDYEKGELSPKRQVDTCWGTFSAALIIVHCAVNFVQCCLIDAILVHPVP